MSLLQKSRACIKPGNVDAVIASEAKQSSLVMAFKDEQIMFGSSTETVGQNYWLRWQGFGFVATHVFALVGLGGQGFAKTDPSRAGRHMGLPLPNRWSNDLGVSRHLPPLCNCDHKVETHCNASLLDSGRINALKSRFSMYLGNYRNPKSPTDLIGEANV